MKILTAFSLGNLCSTAVFVTSAAGATLASGHAAYPVHALVAFSLGGLVALGCFIAAFRADLAAKPNKDGVKRG